MYRETDFFETVQSVRPERMAEVAVSGSVNPQFNWGGLLKSVGGSLLDMI